MEQTNSKGSSRDLRLWAWVGALVLLLIGLGMIASFIIGADISSIFKKFAEINPILIVLAVVLIVAGVVGLALYKPKPLGKKSASKKGWTVKEVIVGALCIGLAFVLSYFRLYKMPMGGSVTPASMLPIMIFAYIYGTPKGAVVALTFALLQIIQDTYIVHWAQLLLDYVFAFGCLSLTGLFKKNIVPGMVLAVFGRFFFSFLSGFIFFAEYAPEGMSPVVYSLGYQATYLIPEIAICIVLALIPGIRKNITMLKSQATVLKSI